MLGSNASAGVKGSSKQSKKKGSEKEKVKRMKLELQFAAHDDQDPSQDFLSAHQQPSKVAEPLQQVLSPVLPLFVSQHRLNV